MSDVPDETPAEVTVRVPEDRAAGDYANGIAVGFNANELVLDLYVDVNGPGQPGPVVELVRRVRLPISLAGELMRSIGGSMDSYENVFGTIHVPVPGAQSGPDLNEAQES